MYSIVITTCSSEEQSNSIVNELLARKLAACIQVIPIRSHYVWKGEVCNEPELQLVIKTQTNLYTEVENCIKEKHSYEVPEIIQIPITDGSSAYLNWINEQTSK